MGFGGGLLSNWHWLSSIFRQMLGVALILTDWEMADEPEVNHWFLNASFVKSQLCQVKKRTLHLVFCCLKANFFSSSLLREVCTVMKKLLRSPELVPSWPRVSCPLYSYSRQRWEQQHTHCSAGSQRQSTALGLIRKSQSSVMFCRWKVLTTKMRIVIALLE